MNQEKQPEALRLADEIEDWRGDHFCDAVLPAAAELRRLHTENERLKTEFAARTGITIGSQSAKEIVEIHHVNNLFI